MCVCVKINRSMGTSININNIRDTCPKPCTMLEYTLVQLGLLLLAGFSQKKARGLESRHYASYC